MHATYARWIVQMHRLFSSPLLLYTESLLVVRLVRSMMDSMAKSRLREYMICIMLPVGGRPTCKRPEQRPEQAALCSAAPAACKTQ